jgi:hypothetical protein
VARDGHANYRRSIYKTKGAISIAFPTGKPKVEQVVLRGVLSAVHGYPYDDGSLEDHGLKLGSW